MSLPALSFVFNFVFPVLPLFLCPCFAKLDFALFPDVFPCIIYKKEKKKEKTTTKKHLAYFSL